MQKFSHISNATENRILLQQRGNLLMFWEGSRVRKDKKQLWKAAPLCLIWCLLIEINRRTFDGKEQSLERFKNSFLNLLYFWVDHSFPVYVDTFIDFVKSFRL
uniref:Uncharacterized protein n=1 Tax=Davidia involucrata TaxID=16924 RepID=A0A5B7CF91_DAVIN